MSAADFRFDVLPRRTGFVRFNFVTGGDVVRFEASELPPSPSAGLAGLVELSSSASFTMDEDETESLFLFPK